MEARKITIVETKNQKKSVILSDATTLGELKADLRNNGIDYDGMTFFEGTSKTELKIDDSILPHDVPYKGQITNELVFMLTNTNKKIKSGQMLNIPRKEIYSIIKSRGLQDACKEKFGKNFTMCKTDDLLSLINSVKAAEANQPVTVTVTETPASDPKNNNCDCVDVQARKAIEKLLDILYDLGSIDDQDINEVLGILEINHNVKNTDKSDSPYSNDEIDDMFDFCK